jgi:AraC family ethanolamine operon transcriptional activator
MAKPKASSYFEYNIQDADSYQAVLSGANLQISQLGPGRLNGRHVRLSLPGGEFSYVETSLPLRGCGTFPNLWTLSVVLQSQSRSLQHGIEVRSGSLVIHRPGVEHDGVYGRNFKVVCFALRDEVLAKYIRRLSPKLQDAVRQPWSVFEPRAASRQKIIARFAKAVAIVQAEPRVHNSRRALAKFQAELVRDFLEGVAQQFPSHSLETDQRAAAMVHQVDEAVKRSRLSDATVVELCAACKVPRRTLNRAFQNAVGMGPATYFRRVRLNRARRALQRVRARSTTVTNVALELGFRHLGRFAKQYNELFGESPHETQHRADGRISGGAGR